MIRGLYTSATGMAAQQKRMEVITNNLANATTAGFKQDDLLTSSFEDLMVRRTGDSTLANPSVEIGVLNYGIHIDEVTTSFENGTLKETGNSTDFAVEGDGFFVVNTPAGERYTRTGTWTVSSTGNLVTQEGYEVQGTQGPIRVGNASFAVSADGTVQSAAGTDQIRLVTFEDVNSLRKEGNNLYIANNTTPAAGGGGKIRQGYLESSNVDLSKQVTDMIQTYRSFEISQRMIRMQDEKLGKSVNEIGKI